MYFWGWARVWVSCRRATGCVVPRNDINLILATGGNTINNGRYLMYNWIKHFCEAIIISDKHHRNWDRPWTIEGFISNSGVPKCRKSLSFYFGSSDFPSFRWVFGVPEFFVTNFRSTHMFPPIFPGVCWCSLQLSVVFRGAPPGPRLRKLRDPGCDAPGVRDRGHPAPGDALGSAAHTLQCLGSSRGSPTAGW